MWRFLWEKGKRIPEIDSLKELSKIFNVSIDEILLGERDSKSNLTLTLYEESLHLRKVLKIFLYLLISLIFGFLLYYFFQLYKSINIYTIYGFGNNFNVNGLLVKTNEKLYFNIGNINKKHEFKINKKI